jgi:CheY-like chemotaxis protein
MARLLIVDDDPTIRHLIRRTLERAGHDMIEAENGRDALRQLAESHIDLVLLDLNMPQMEGVETVREMRRSFPKIKVIVISGVELIYLSGMQLLGADAALRKPFLPEELRQTVARLLAEPSRVGILAAGSAPR